MYTIVRPVGSGVSVMDIEERMKKGLNATGEKRDIYKTRWVRYTRSKVYCLELTSEGFAPHLQQQQQQQRWQRNSFGREIFEPGDGKVR